MVPLLLLRMASPALIPVLQAAGSVLDRIAQRVGEQPVPVPDVVAAVLAGNSRSWREAAETTRKMAEEHTTALDHAQRLAGRLDAPDGYLSPSSALALERVRRYSAVMAHAETSLRANAGNLDSVAGFFEETKKKMQAMDAPPQKTFFDVLAPWETDTERKIREYNAAVNHNLGLYNSYADHTRAQQKALINDYGDAHGLLKSLEDAESDVPPPPPRPMPVPGPSTPDFPAPGPGASDGNRHQQHETVLPVTRPDLTGPDRTAPDRAGLTGPDSTRSGSTGSGFTGDGAGGGTVAASYAGAPLPGALAGAGGTAGAGGFAASAAGGLAGSHGYAGAQAGAGTGVTGSIRDRLAGRMAGAGGAAGPAGTGQGAGSGREEDREHRDRYAVPEDLLSFAPDIDPATGLRVAPSSLGDS